MGEKHKCAQCRRELDIGVDAIKVNAGVIGTKDFVPLDEAMFFCRDKCIKEYYDLGDLPSVSERIP